MYYVREFAPSDDQEDDDIHYQKNRHPDTVHSPALVPRPEKQCKQKTVSRFRETVVRRKRLELPTF